LKQAREALNTAPRFDVPGLDTDSYAIAALCDDARLMNAIGFCGGNCRAARRLTQFGSVQNQGADRIALF